MRPVEEHLQSHPCRRRLLARQGFVGGLGRIDRGCVEVGRERRACEAGQQDADQDAFRAARPEHGKSTFENGNAETQQPRSSFPTAPLSLGSSASSTGKIGNRSGLAP
jgi:hypothetical protein